MNKIVKNLGFLKVKSWNNVRLFRKFAATSIFTAIIISLCNSNLAFAEIGGGTRILAMLGTRHGR